MTQHTLFVCKSCSATVAHEDVAANSVTEGVLLLNQLKVLQHDAPFKGQVKVEAVGCLWTCDRPCSVTFACPGKYTYHFAGLSDTQSVTDLLEFSEQYINHPEGYVKPPEMPGDLRSRLLVRVPPLKP